MLLRDHDIQPFSLLTKSRSSFSRSAAKMSSTEEYDRRLFRLRPLAPLPWLPLMVSVLVPVPVAPAPLPLLVVVVVPPPALLLFLLVVVVVVMVVVVVAAAALEQSDRQLACKGRPWLA